MVTATQGSRTEMQLQNPKNNTKNPHYTYKIQKSVVLQYIIGAPQ